jgi:hypothetical protein
VKGDRFRLKEKAQENRNTPAHSGCFCGYIYHLLPFYDRPVVDKGGSLQIGLGDAVDARLASSKSSTVPLELTER